ncbi:MAG: hypothetical protein QOF61_2975, partial [Acidobacteriota bacterium]|nr:hypothetical protein [Acidobacteriota bacterium]
MKITILIKATLSLTLFLLLATISFAASGHADERESILKACEVLFGKPVDVKENLF